MSEREWICEAGVGLNNAFRPIETFIRLVREVEHFLFKRETNEPARSITKIFQTIPKDAVFRHKQHYFLIFNTCHKCNKAKVQSSDKMNEISSK